MLYYARGEVIDMKPASEIFPEQASTLTSVRDYARGRSLAASA